MTAFLQKVADASELSDLIEPDNQFDNDLASTSPSNHVSLLSRLSVTTWWLWGGVGRGELPGSEVEHKGASWR